MRQWAVVICAISHIRLAALVAGTPTGKKNRSATQAETVRIAGLIDFASVAIRAMGAGGFCFFPAHPQIVQRFENEQCIRNGRSLRVASRHRRLLKENRLLKNKMLLVNWPVEPFAGQKAGASGSPQSPWRDAAGTSAGGE